MADTQGQHEGPSHLAAVQEAVTDSKDVSQQANQGASAEGGQHIMSAPAGGNQSQQSGLPVVSQTLELARPVSDRPKHWPQLPPDDGRIVLLFDMNGVLTEKTPTRVEGRYVKRDHIVRPFIEEILRLHQHFVIGIYSSATIRTVNAALDKLYAVLQRKRTERAAEGLLLPSKSNLFSIVLHRDHCSPDPYWQTRPDGKDHDTIKPLARLGFALNRTVLVDNDDYKAADGEHENMLHIPHWERTAATDRDFPLLIQLILHHLKAVQGDVRPQLRTIERELRRLRQATEAQLKSAEASTQARAVQAATLGNWTGDGGLLEALAADGLAVPGANPGAPGDQRPAQLRLPISGLKLVTAAALEEAPAAAKQLMQLLAQYTAGTSEPETSTAGLDVVQLLSAEGHEAALEQYKQHTLVALLAALWACGVTAPAGSFTLRQLKDVLDARGCPTAHLHEAVQALVTGGLIKVWSDGQQQQHQQQSWPWPACAGAWPSLAVPVPVAEGPAASNHAVSIEQQQEAWQECFLLQQTSRVKQSRKAAHDVAALKDASPTDIKLTLQLMQLNARLASSAEPQPQLRQQAQELLAQKATAPERQKTNALAHAWTTTIRTAARDLAASPGVTLSQLIRFIGGLEPSLQTQIIGPACNINNEQQVMHQQQQQQLQMHSLQEQLQSLQGAVAAVPSRPKFKQYKTLLGPLPSALAVLPWSMHGWSKADAQDGAAEQNGPSDSAAPTAQLTHYAVGIIPDEDSVRRSLEVLKRCAAATDAAAVIASLEVGGDTEQQQQVQQQDSGQQAPESQTAKEQLTKLPVAACICASTTLSVTKSDMTWLQQQQQAVSAAGGVLSGACNAAEEAHTDGKRSRHDAESAGTHLNSGLSPSKKQRVDCSAAAAGSQAGVPGAHVEQEPGSHALDDAAERRTVHQQQQAAVDSAEVAQDMDDREDGQDNGDEEPGDEVVDIYPDDDGEGSGEDDDDDDDGDGGGEGLGGGACAGSHGGDSGGGGTAGSGGGMGGGGGVAQLPRAAERGAEPGGCSEAVASADARDPQRLLEGEDDSDAWGSDAELDDQLQLGITGLDGDEDFLDAAAAADSDGCGDSGGQGAWVLDDDERAGDRACFPAGVDAASMQARGRSPLYGSLQAALAEAQQLKAAAFQEHGQQQQQPQETHLSRLHWELLQFAAAAAPCAVERLFITKGIQLLQGVASRLWTRGSPEALLFGSQASGLALPGSDLDVVLLRVPGCAETFTGRGYHAHSKKRVTVLLGNFARQLKREGLAGNQDIKVVKARIPILRGTIWVDIPRQELLQEAALDSNPAVQQLVQAAASSADSVHQGPLRVPLQVDISIGMGDSTAAVSYLQRQVLNLPPLRPLLLAVKAHLREAGLNMVFTGGLGSYALALMVISHLQAEGLADPHTSAMLPSDHDATCHQTSVQAFVQQVSEAAACQAHICPSSSGNNLQQPGQLDTPGDHGTHRQQQQQWDLGLLLQGFLLRFGVLFDYAVEAVAVNHGGVLFKPAQWVKPSK